MIALMYFTFTSLSTVGFGDYHPKNNTERLCCAFILMIGVAVFSSIMGVFIEIVEKYKELDKPLDDGDNLTRFFGVLEHYNYGKPLSDELRSKLETFFNHKWSTDKN